MLRLTLFFIILSYGVQAQDSLSLNFSPGNFLSWCLTTDDFKTNITQSGNWLLMESEYDKKNKITVDFFDSQDNLFVTLLRYTRKDKSVVFYALNHPDGAWILKLLADLMALKESRQATLEYDTERSCFVSTLGTQTIEITFGKSMFTVFIIPDYLER